MTEKKKKNLGLPDICDLQMWSQAKKKKRLGTTALMSIIFNLLELKIEVYPKQIYQVFRTLLSK